MIALKGASPLMLLCNSISGKRICQYRFIAPLGSRLQGIPPASIRFFSQRCTKACLCSEQAGPNSHPVLKARSAQTGGPERPGREGRAFHLLFPISFAKYNCLLKKIRSTGSMPLRLQIPAVLWDGCYYGICWMLFLRFYIVLICGEYIILAFQLV